MYSPQKLRKHREILTFHLPGDLPAIASRSGEAGGYRQMKGLSLPAARDLDSKDLETGTPIWTEWTEG